MANIEKHLRALTRLIALNIGNDKDEAKRLLEWAYSDGSDRIALDQDDTLFREEEKPTKTRRFVKPTVEEVDAYCKERGNMIPAQDFWDFYESKGWKIGTSPMKDWKAAVRTWERTKGFVYTPRENAPAPSKYQKVSC